MLLYITDPTTGMIFCGFVAAVFVIAANYVDDQARIKAGIKPSRLKKKVDRIVELPDTWDAKDVLAWKHADAIIQPLLAKGIIPNIHGNDNEVEVYEIWTKMVNEIAEYRKKTQTEAKHKNHKVDDSGKVTYRSKTVELNLE